MTPRLYLDEDIIPELARILRSRGFDAVSAHELGAFGLPDDEQLVRATADDRVLLTFNFVDFLKLAQEWRMAGREHAGIVVSYRQYSRRGLGQLARAAIALLQTLSAEDLRNSVQTLDPFRTRSADI